ncbi:MAG: preprotein translocase subunit SecE [Lachnospiraceae bacterium]|nr:preprotein translocase subunit SecE [Lachnospiraceae bacterium]MDE6759698.1 preprotein translocase subunit SecE [Lachnospiraceae bacterium]
MANENESTSLKRSFFTELKGEFRKIIWPDKKLLGKQSVAVIIAAIVIGCIIAAIDWLMQIGLSFIIG